MYSSALTVIEEATLGKAWMAISSTIMQKGYQAEYDGAETMEIARMSVVIEQPDPEDKFIKNEGDAAWLQWMHENFFVQKTVRELGDAASYAVRLFNYNESGRDQIQWVIERIRKNPEARSATISTFQPLTDTSYIPCISLLDFWVRDHAIELIVYAHSLDFGKKAYGNLVELSILQKMVAEKTGYETGRLVIHVKTAHIYQPEWEFMKGLIQKADSHQENKTG